MKTLSKAEGKRNKAKAIKRGEKTYDDTPCRKCGHTERYTNSGKCTTCHAERNKRRKRGKVGKTASTAVAPINSEPISGEVISGEHWRFYADRITTTWRKATGSIIETGALLLEAKDRVEHGEFEEMIERELPFGPRAARMLMDIARNPILSDRNHGSVLPPSWRTLYELTRLSEPVLLAKIKDHSIHPEMERRDVNVIFASVTGRAVRRTKTKRKEGPSLLEENMALSDQVDDYKARVDELEAAARELDFTEVDDETMAKQILGWIGKERASRLIAELEKLIRAEAA
jgi:hypothetical protein